ncbi:hypothetical protein Csac_0021 [Caldicellulosiruptor saccharolyticus DSM 8903]|uniref:Uncharacterized protein n=1 Tax=Caldicellulosiruptor saccharolyticus (strain ATCC 43494 / DSM 8903 / Tp8T 6331) TaxID=351627 RepID=A4XFJ7_CALS8|nr:MULTISPECIES: hypothetical protein [Caldicellulosiruptor]ABP65682.1 hypothetical protein Csac_0021 [Caldicellulosiruptor saccharolyticus DSM 8903]
MGYITTNLQEIADIVLKNISLPDLIKEIDIDGSEINVKIKPVTILPEIALKFTITSEAEKIVVLFDPAKSVIIYGFLLGKLKDEQIPGITLFKERLEIDLQKLLLQNIKGIKIQNVFVTSSGEIKIDFSCG